MAAPPLLAGAVNVTLAEPLPAVAVPMVGAPGTVAGAATVSVIAVGLFRPPLFVTAIDLVPVVDEVAVNVAVALPTGRVTLVGLNVTPDTAVGVTVTAALRGPLVPTVYAADAAPLVPVVGPVRVTALATAGSGTAPIA